MARLDGQQFLRLTQTRADLSQADARRAIEAVLATLGERISGGEFEDLVGELPREIGGSLGYDATHPAENFDAQEFLRRVGARVGKDPAEAEALTHAVLSVVAETVSKQEADDARSELPADLKPLFQEISKPTQAP